MKSSQFILLILALTSCNPWKSSCHISNAAEIVATKEWQLLKEGDTIPAGLQIKMDLSTGEKWVKLIEKNDE